MKAKYVVVAILVGLIAFAVSSLWNSNQSKVDAVTTKAANSISSEEATVADDVATREPDSIYLDSSGDGSLHGKSEQRRANALNNTGMTQSELDALDSHLKSAFYDPESADQFQQDLRADMTANVGAEEADFNMKVLGLASENWRDAKALILERSSSTGANYDELTMKVGLASGAISTNELETLVQRGMSLPNDAVLQLAQSGNIEAIAGLATRGHAIDVNYQDPITGTNALSALIQDISHFPSKYEPDDVTNALNTLIGIGVEAKPQSGSQDPLDFALARINKSNAEAKLATARVLLNQGVPVEESHRELLNHLPSGPIKEQFLELFVNQL